MFALASSDFAATGVLALLLLLPGLLVVAAPWPAVPFLSLAFWVGLWSWSGVWPGSRVTALETCLMFFAGLAALRLIQPFVGSRPTRGTWLVVTAAVLGLLPMALTALDAGPSAPHEALAARLLLARDGWPLTEAPFAPERAFSTTPLGLLAGDVALLSGAPAARCAFAVSLAARGLLAVALLLLVKRLTPQREPAGAALVTLGLATGLPDLAGALVLSLACTIAGVALLARGSGRPGATAAGACFGAGCLAAAPLALAGLALGLWLGRHQGDATDRRARAIAAGGWGLAFAGPNVLANVIRGDPWRLGNPELALIVGVCGVAVWSVRRPVRLAPGAFVALAGLILLVSNLRRQAPFSADDWRALAYLRGAGALTDVVCLDAPLGLAWFPVLAERRALVAAQPDGVCRWHLRRWPHGSGARPAGRSVFRSGGVEILELR